MKLIFLGYLYPKERENEIKENSKDGFDNPSNNFQWALLEGLDYFYPNLKVFSVPNISSYPFSYKKILFKKSVFSHKVDANDYCLGFINLPLIKHLSEQISLKTNFKKQIDNENETIIIIYGIHSPFLKTVVDLKKRNKNIKICLIVPDLPQYMSESKNPIYLFFKKIDSLLIYKYLKRIDSFVLLSDHMAGELNIGNRPWTRVEGVFHVNEFEEGEIKKEKEKTILYTGKIDSRYGIKILLKAFSLIVDENYRLWIRGDGNTKNEILLAAENDPRIKYFNGMTKKDLFKLQKRATVLINPISTKEKFTKYFFPSKTMEYLASGTPTILYRLKGIPDEYFKYCFVVDDETPEGLKEMILNVCEKDPLELDKFGKKASRFILENKNPVIQVKKIYDLIND